MTVTRRLVIAMLLLLVLVGGVEAQPATFARTDLTIGTFPTAVAIGDFNSDGKLDLAVGKDPSKVAILLGNGDGTFGPKTEFTTSFGPFAVVTGDFNGDGKLDVAVASESSDAAGVMLGDGLGGLGAATNYTVGNSPRSLATGDFNGDAKLDLAVANNFDASLSVLLGNGDGTFAAKTDYSVSSSPYAVAVADFNGDGRQDVAVANEFSDSVSILLGNGDGTFGPKTNFTTGRGPRAVMAGDFNRDGKLDLATANITTHNASILLGNGDGTFGAKTDFPTGTAPDSAVAGDFNLDGKLDLAVANLSANTLSILMGNGDGTLAAKTDLATGTAPMGLAMADLNSDGRPDLALANRNIDSVSVFLNTTSLPPSGTFFGVTYHADATAGAPTKVVTGDFNRDGVPDLAVGNVDGSDATDDYISILLGLGNGTFGPRTDFLAGGSIGEIASGDFNRDGKLDLASANYKSNTISILLGNGNGTFGPKTDLAVGDSSQAVVVGDFNRDGKPDIVASNANSNTISIFLGNGDGTFGAKTDVAAGSGPLGMAVADFNRDGKPDLAVANWFTGDISIFLGNGDGTFGAMTNFAATWLTVGVAVADLNRDGKLDLVAANYGAAAVSVLLGNGDGTFAAKTDYPTGGGVQQVAISDFNRDGIPDVAASNNSGPGGVSILPGNGDGTFALRTDWATTNATHGVAVGDLNRDGTPDVVANTAVVFQNRIVAVLLNNPVNIPPTANAGPDQNVQAGTMVTLDGSGSSDPDGTPLTFQWSQLSGPAVTLNVMGAMATWQATLTGTYEFELTVEDAWGGSASDTVQVLVVDTTLPSITVTRPNLSGEKLFVGMSYLIEWTASDNGTLDRFDVEFSTNGGGAYSPVPGCTGVSGSARNCLWASPGPTTSAGRIRVRAFDTAGNSAVDISNANFSIVAGSGSITVTQPNTVLDWGIGSTQQIKWNHNLGSNAWVMILLSRDGRENWEVITSSFKNTSSGSGSFNWVVTGPAVENTARIRVVGINVPASDIGNVDFTISEPYVAPLAPSTTATNAGYGSVRSQPWATNLGPLDRVNVLMSTDGGVTFPITLASNIVASNKNVAYTTPTLGAPASDVRTRVEWIANPTVGGMNPVKIKVQPAYIKVTSPNISTDAWIVGTTQNVTWSNNLGPSENVKIELSLDGGSTYPIVVLASTPSDGTQAVTVQAGWASSMAVVRITWLKNGAVMDTSTQPFVIQ